MNRPETVVGLPVANVVVDHRIRQAHPPPPFLFLSLASELRHQGTTSAPSLTMRGYNFAERLRRILAYACEETARLAAPFTDTDHILRGLLRERSGVGAFLLEELGADLTALSEDLEREMPRIEGAATPTADLPYTARAKRVMELSMVIARDLGHN